MSGEQIQSLVEVGDSLTQVLGRGGGASVLKRYCLVIYTLTGRSRPIFLGKSYSKSVQTYLGHCVS